MDVGIAVVSGRKSYVYLYDYNTKNWNGLFGDNGPCQIKVLQRGRNEFLIRVADESNRNNEKEYSLSNTCEVNKVGDMLQVPAKDPNPCMLGIKFRDQNDEVQFLLRVGEKLVGFNKPVRSRLDNAPPPSRPVVPNPVPNASYNPPTLAPRFHNASTEVHPPDRLPPSASRIPQTGMLGTQPPRNAFVGGANYSQEEPIMGANGRGNRYHPPEQHRPPQGVEDQYRKYDAPINRGDRGNYGDLGNYGDHGNYGDRGDPGRFGNSGQHPNIGHHGNNNYPPPIDGRGYMEGARQRPNGREIQDPYRQRDFPRHQEHQQRTPPSVRKPYNQPSDHAPSSLKSSSTNKLSDSDFKGEVDHYAQQLASMLSCGRKTDAIQLVELLATMMDEQREGSTNSMGVFSMNFDPDKESQTADNTKFDLSVFVEEFEKESYPLYLTVSPSDSVDHLKLELQKKFKVPKECQTWIYGAELVEDRKTLRDLEITDDTDQVYVYVQHPKKVKGMTNRALDQLREVGGGKFLPHNDPTPLIPVTPAKRDQDGGYPYRPQQRGGYPLEPENVRPRNPNRVPSHGSIQDIPELPHPTNQIPPGGHIAKDEVVFRGDSNHSLHTLPPGRSPSGGVRVMPVEMPLGPPAINNELEPIPPPNDKPVDEAPPPGWECPSCTFNNKPYRPGCEMCDHVRPEDYIPPINYVLTEEEKKWVDQSKQQDLLLQRMFQQEQEQKKQNAEKNYNRYMEAEDQALVTNTEPFDCPVCLLETDPGDGITLRSCLHQVCKQCLHGSITTSEHVEVPCPFTDGNYSCEERISDREIRVLLDDEELEALYNRGLRQAEAAARDSFHCQTMDCPGFCFYEDEVNEYKCGVCGKLNCILCKAQHPDMNCQEYQDDLKRKAVNDDAARETQKMLENMVAQGEAMHCPQCRVIVTKKVGCDWIKCTVCKTEMCWATKGPRWGPGGRGDTSGGCKCGLNRQRCHPNCRNCH